MAKQSGSWKCDTCCRSNLEIATEFMEPITADAALDLKKDNVILNKLGQLDAF